MKNLAPSAAKEAAYWLHRPKGVSLPPNVALFVMRIKGDLMTTFVMYQRASATTGTVTKFIDPDSSLYQFGKSYISGKTLPFK